MTETVDHGVTEGYVELDEQEQETILAGSGIQLVVTPSANEM